MLKRLSIQSQLMLMLLLVSLGSSIVIAYQGYRSGKQALEDSIFKQLTSLRASRSDQIETYFEGLRAQLSTLGESPLTLEAIAAFERGFDQLQNAELRREWDLKTDAYYELEFLPRLRKTVEGDPQLQVYRPFRKATRYLQYHYIANNSELTDQRRRLVAAPDGSDYSKTHAQYHSVFLNLSDRLGFYNIFLINPEGNILYSVSKEADFGTSLREGPFSESNLEQAFSLALKSEKGSVIVTDFEAYRASHGAPAAFLASPLYRNANLVGVIAVQLPIDQLNQLMTSDRNWAREGLGQTGETYLVGPDNLMRSQSRVLIEQPEAYFADLVQRGLPEAELERIRQLNTSILTQRIDSPLVQQALEGKSGTVIRRDHRDRRVLTAYGPLQLNGLRWAILADIETTEAFTPIAEFERTIIITTAILMLGVTLTALALARQFLTPINRLAQGFEAVQKGKTHVEIPVTSQDEFGQLTEAFNNTVKSLRRKSQIVKEKEAESRALLASIVPEDVAQRIRNGEQNIADTYNDVTVLFANLDGFSKLAESLSAEQTLGLLNEIIISFDEAAERFGIEKIKTLGSGYMAVCGLAVPRLDSAKRMIDFAQEMLRRTLAFNHSHGLALHIQIGINTGDVVAGVVGSRKFIYDIWGKTVNIAHHIHSLRNDAIQITEGVYQRVGTVYEFHPLVEAQQLANLQGEAGQIWSLGGEISSAVEPSIKP
jgi:class 3 adenylate cyclase